MYESSGYTGLANYYCAYKIFRRRSKNIASVLIRLFFLAASIYMIFIWLPFIREGYFISAFTVFFIVYLIFALPQLFPDLYAAIRAYRIVRKKPAARIFYRDDRISLEREDSVSVNYYSEITEIIEIKGTFYLLLGDYQISFEDKKRLTGGDPEAFGAFLSEKCSLPVRRFSSVLAYRKE